jgi:hypothetical protein
MNEQSGQGPADAGGGQPTEAELQAALEEQMRNLRVEDVLVQTTVTLVNLGAQRLGLTAGPGEEPGPERDLDQAKTAIEAVRVLLPLCPAEVGQQIAPALSQLQMAFAREAQGGAASPAEGGVPDGEAPAGDPAGDQASEADAERAKARAKIWTPPGA